MSEFLKEIDALIARGVDPTEAAKLVNAERERLRLQSESKMEKDILELRLEQIKLEKENKSIPRSPSGLHTQYGKMPYGNISTRSGESSGLHSPINGKMPSGTSSTRSGGSSGLHTPINGKMSSGNSTTSSVGYYYDELNKHFCKHNDCKNRYRIILSKFLCQIQDGKTVVHEVVVDKHDSTSIRNLYLMLYASEYNVEKFLKKWKDNEFGGFNGCDEHG